MQNRTTEELVYLLIDASYDTGYYSGKGEDGKPHHLEAINKRELIRDELVKRITQKSDAEALCKVCARGKKQIIACA